MACPQTENGFTMIANELYDALNSYNFPSASPLKLVHIVIRKTYGFKKKEDYISLTQFEKSSKLSRPTVVYWLDALVKSLLLVKGVKLSKNGYTYGINKDFECWKPLVNSLKLVKPRQFTSKPPLTATSKPPLTHKRKKEIVTKEIFLPPSLSELKEYIALNEYNVDPEQWLNFYESKGWLIGKVKMKNWKAAVRTWAGRNKYLPKIDEKEQEARALVEQCRAQFGNDAEEVAMFRFSKKYGKGSEMKYKGIFHL